MNKEYISEFIGNTEMTIVDAMGKIDHNAKGILFIVNEKNSLVGCITDGDIRRWLLKTGDLSASVSVAMNGSPKSLLVEERDKAEKLMHERGIIALPIIDQNMTIIDIIWLSDEDEYVNVKKRKSLEGTPVVIMAGGQGTRLYPYTKILPKPLIPIGEIPIVERIIDSYTEYKINQFYMTVNYKKGMIRAYFSELNPDYDIKYVEENKPLGTGGSIRLIDDKFDKPLFVTNCDALILADYADIYKYHVDSGNAITIVSALKNVVVPYGVLHPGENGGIIDMEEKPKLSYFINTGMYVINPETIEMIPYDTFFHMTQLVDLAMKSGKKVGVYPISEDSFLDMGEFGEMKRMEEKLNIIE